MPSPLQPVNVDHAPGLSRRRVLTGGVIAGAALAVGGRVEATTNKVDAPGTALAGARRLGLEPDQEPPAEDPPEEDAPIEDPPAEGAPPEEFVPPEPGEILFPIVVGEDDSCFVLNNFGACRSGCSRRHEGVDIMADQGLPIRAVEDGVITNRYDDSGKLFGAGHGWTVTSAETNTTWKFFHMDSHAEGLEVGDSVVQGQIIGYVGNTGTSGANSDSNYHLHFEYRPNNSAQDSFSKLQRDPNVSFA
ncbi:MAG: M23 family metallopeptidase [Ilumatobacter sp.]